MCLTSSGHVYVWKYTQETPSQEKKNNSFVSSSLSSSTTSTSTSGSSNGTSHSQANTSEANPLNITALINRESCQFILRTGDWLDCDITDTGVPIINMSKNKSYYFSSKTKCWHLLPCIGTLTGDSSHLLVNSNTVFGSTKYTKLSQDSANGPLSQIQSRNKSSSILKTIETINKGANSNLFSKQDFTLTHLESQVNAAIGLNSAKEYKFWLMTLARYLVENNYEDKLTEMCNFLLGPLYSSNWNHTFLTYNKRDLLREIIVIIADNLNLQRLYSYYKQQLNLISNLSTKTSVLDRLVSSNRTVLSSKSLGNSSASLATSMRVKDVEKPKPDTEKSVRLDECENQVEMQEEASAPEIKASEMCPQESQDIFKMPDIPVQQETLVVLAKSEIEEKIDEEKTMLHEEPIKTEMSEPIVIQPMISEIVMENNDDSMNAKT